jgi:ADP-heptose:LPS heptosyltransferase
LMSLPLICETLKDSVPWDGPYIKASSSKLDEWRKKLELSKTKQNIGICWFAGARNYNSSNWAVYQKKSVPFEQIKPILDVDAKFYSLQEHSDDLPDLNLQSFNDTAAVIELMDCVVTVDTSVANLAGAMGKKTYLMNPYDGCWRWSKNISTPWYPNVTVVQQKESGEWGSVIQTIIEHLSNQQQIAA